MGGRWFGLFWLDDHGRYMAEPMKNLKLLLIAIFAMPVSCAFAQKAIKIDTGPHSTFVEGGTKRTIAWNDMVDRVVDVDGLAWGALEKGLGSHLVLANSQNGKVYLRGADLLEADLNGRLVRVSGVLRKTRVEAAPKFAQGYSKPFEYFYLDVVQISPIDRLELDQLLPTENDWVLPGSAVADVERMIQSRSLEAYTLALRASTDGSTTKSFLVSDGLVLACRVLDGRVISVSKILLNEPGKMDDEWVSINGFKLPPVPNSVR